MPDFERLPRSILLTISKGTVLISSCALDLKLDAKEPNRPTR